MSGLGNRILRHWQPYRPNQVRHLQRAAQLHQRVEAAANQHGQVYEEAVQRGLAADQADELARQDWITPESNRPDQET